MIVGLIIGTLILLIGMAIGGIIVYFYVRKTEKAKEEQKPNPYDKYKNQDGLYSRSTVKSR